MLSGGPKKVSQKYCVSLVDEAQLRILHVTHVNTDSIALKPCRERFGRYSISYFICYFKVGDNS